MFEPPANSSVSNQIKEYLKLLIEQNRHNPNFQFPSENQLAKQFNVSRSPAKKAISELRNEGLIYTIHGKGTFIKPLNDTQKKLSFNLIMPHIDSPYMLGIVKGIRDFVADRNIRLLVSFSEDNPVIEESAINYYTSQAFSGLLLYPIVNATYHDALLKLALSKSPVVVIGHYLPKIRFSCIHCDNYNQILNAVKFLASKGHSQIGFIGESDKYNNEIYKIRFTAFRDSVKNILNKNFAPTLGVELPTRVEKNKTETAIDEDIRNFIDNNRDMSAIIVSGVIAEKVIDYLTIKDGNNLKHCVLIIDEPDNLHKFNRDNIFIINQNPYEIGRRAAQQLYEQIIMGKDVEEIIINDEIISSFEMIDRHNKIRNNQ